MDGFDVTISDVQGQMAKRRYTAAAFVFEILFFFFCSKGANTNLLMFQVIFFLLF